MPFHEAVRNWWMRATGNGNPNEAQCQWRWFDNQGTMHQCDNQGEQVHHPIAEAYLLYYLKQNPNDIEGLVVCLFHHIKGKLGIFEENGSFHPDMGVARANYHLYKAQGRNSFEEAGLVHFQKAVRGERFWTGNETTDQYYIEVARQIGMDYAATHPDDPKPSRIHPKAMDIKPGHWYDIFGDSNGNPEMD